ncbi:MAG: MFS transporter [Desulfuromonas sp.]|nr:MFS transporter [Desulfuromonas sp.]
MKSKLVGVLSLGHLVTDVNQGALPAMLPFLIADYGLSYTAAASIVFAANVASSIIQPIFGFAADKSSKPWLLSIGIAAYHPEAARLVNFAAGNSKNTAMSFFGVGGTIGFATGPIFITSALLAMGSKGTVVLILPVALMVLVMTTQYSKLSELTVANKQQKKMAGMQHEKEHWWAFIRLTIVIIGRSVIFFGLNTFIPIYWINHLQQSKVAGSLALSFFAVAGIFGNLSGGRLADRFGRKNIIVAGFLGLTLFLPIFILINNVQLALLTMIPIGFILYATYSPSIVMGQSFLPKRVGLSSGITLGVAISIGGAVTPLLGKIADIYGIWYALATVACLPIIFLLIAMSLPEANTTVSVFGGQKK